MKASITLQDIYDMQVTLLKKVERLEQYNRDRDKKPFTVDENKIRKVELKIMGK